jgi:hypothetical protein
MRFTNFDGGPWGTDTNWTNTAMMTDHHVPTSNDTALIDTVTGVTITHYTGSDTVGGLILSAGSSSLVIDGSSTLQVTGSLSVSNSFTLTVNNGTLFVQGAATISGAGTMFTLNAGASASFPNSPSALTITTSATLNVNGGSLSVPAPNAFAVNNSTFNFNGGTITGTPTLTGSTLNIGTGATSAARFVMHNNDTLSGTVAMGQTVWAQGGGGGGHANLAVANGTTNCGTIQLETSDGGWDSNLVIPAGATFTNAGIIQANASGGGFRNITGSTTGVYQAAGGSIQGPAVVINAQVQVTASPPEGMVTTIPLAGDKNTLLGDNLARTTLWVQGRSFYGNAVLRLAAGASNAGIIQLESSSGGYESNLVIPSIPNGTFTNGPDSVIQVNKGNGGGGRTITGNLTNKGHIDVTADTSLALTGGVYEAAGGFIQGVGYVLDATVWVTASPPEGMVTTVRIHGNSTLLENNRARTVLWVEGSYAGGHANLAVANGTSNAGTIQLGPSDGGYDSNLVIPAGTTFTNAPGGIIQANASGGGFRNITGSTTGVYQAAGGSIQGPAVVINAQVRVTASPPEGMVTTIPLAGNNNTLLGNNLAGTTLWVQGRSFYGDAILRLAAGASNAGTILLETSSGGYDSNLMIPAGATFANAGIIQANASGGGARNITGSTTGIYEAAGGSIQGPAVVINAQVQVTASPPEGMVTTIPLAGNNNTLLGDNLAGTTLWVQGRSFYGDAILRLAAGASNAGTILLETSSGGYDSNLVIPSIPSGTFTNAPDGVIQVNQGAGGGGRTITGDIVNAGTMEVNTGLTVVGNSLGFTNDTTGVLTATGSMNVTQNSFFLNNGQLVVPLGQFDLIGPFYNYGQATHTLTGGTYQITGTFRFDNADVVTNAADITLIGQVSNMLNRITNGNALTNFAVNDAAGSFTIQNGRNFTTSAPPSGDFTNNGILAVGAGSTFVVTGSLTNFADKTLTGGTYLIAGTFQFTNADIQTNAATLLLDGTAARIIDRAGMPNNGLRGFAANAAAGNFTIQNGSNLSISGAFSNAGSLTIGDGSTFTAASYTQTGGNTNLLTGGMLSAAVSLQGGTLSGSGMINGNVTIQNGGTLSGSETINGNVTIQNGGMLSGSETVNGNLTNAGYLTLGPGDTLTVMGTYTQSGTGTLEVQVSSSPADGQFGKLDVKGQATLNGTLTVTPVNYTLVSGDRYRVLTFASRGNPPTDFAMHSNTVDLSYDDTSNPNSLTLVVR